MGSSDLKDKSTVDGGERVTPFENQPELGTDSVQLPRTGQQENNPAPVSRSTESDHNKDTCLCELTLRDPSYGVSLDEEPVWDRVVPRTVQNPLNKIG